MMLKSLFSYIASRWGGHYIDIGGTRAKIERIVSEQGSILDKYGFLENTDKSSVIAGNTRISMSHDYLRHYDFLFHSFRTEKFSLIEFGCAEGGSLRTWEKYFPSAQIYGVDIDENAKRHETERIYIVIGDATSTETFEKLKTSTGGNAFIIFDDASHAWGDQRRSFELFWDLVSPGGFYVIEDLECGSIGAFPEYPPKVLDTQPFSEYMHDLSKILRWAPDRNPEENSYHFEHLPKNIQKIEREMDMCMFIPGAIIVRKKA